MGKSFFLYGPQSEYFKYNFEHKNLKKLHHLARDALMNLALTIGELAWEIKDNVRESRRAQAGELEQEMRGILNLIR